MYHIEYVIGANYGDEGKGQVSAIIAGDYEPNETITVLSAMGAERQNHYKGQTFTHLGSATLDGVATYIDDEFICDPIMFKEEYERISSVVENMPKVYLCKDCKLIMPFHKVIKRTANACTSNFKYMNKTAIYEAARFDDLAHGLCNDVKTMISRENYDKLISYYDMEYIKETITGHYWVNFDNHNNVLCVLDEHYRNYCNADAIEKWYDAFQFMVDHCVLVDKARDVVNLGYKNFICEYAWGIGCDAAIWCGGRNDITYKFMNGRTVPYYGNDIAECLRDKKRTHVYNFVSRWYLTKHGIRETGYGQTMCNLIDSEMFGETNKIDYIDTGVSFGAINIKETVFNMNEVCDINEEITNIWITHIDDYGDRVPVDVVEEDEVTCEDRHVTYYYTMNGFLKELYNTIYSSNCRTPNIMLISNENNNDTMPYEMDTIDTDRLNSNVIATCTVQNDSRVNNGTLYTYDVRSNHGNVDVNIATGHAIRRLTDAINNLRVTSNDSDNPYYTATTSNVWDYLSSAGNYGRR